MRGVAPGELLDPIIFHQGPLEGQLIDLYRIALNQVFRKWLFSENHPPYPSTRFFFALSWPSPSLTLEDGRTVNHY